MIKEAFEKVTNDFVPASRYYLILIQDIPFHGGPEEGGWWGNDSVVVAYKEYVSEELAEEAKASVLALAEELNKEEKDQYGRQCLNEMEWLDNRGLDADYLPEPDGPSEYRVMISDSIPENSYGERSYS